MSATRINLNNTETRESGIQSAVSALQQRKTIVMPTDTVYGIAADAFSPEAVANLLAAKGRSRTMPPPVLIFDKAVLPGLADKVSSEVTALADAFWPGAMTLILYSQPSLQWDLGETKGTVALRVPDDEIAREILKNSGPLAVSSANKTGRLAATSADEAKDQLGNDVELILDGGIRPVGRGEDVSPESVLPSTIIDCTSDRFVVVREGAIPVEKLRQVVPSIVTRSELEEEEKRSRLTPVEDAGIDQAAEVAPVNDGPRAGTAEPGSLHEGLLAAAPEQGGRVDQRRSTEAHLPQAPVRSELTTAPYPVEDAYALVHGGVKDETQQFATNSQPAAAETQTKEAPRTAFNSVASRAETQQPQSSSEPDETEKTPWAERQQD